jgi:hypothetical protein
LTLRIFVVLGDLVELPVLVRLEAEPGVMGKGTCGDHFGNDAVFVVCPIPHKSTASFVDVTTISVVLHLINNGVIEPN